MSPLPDSSHPQLPEAANQAGHGRLSTGWGSGGCRRGPPHRDGRRFPRTQKPTPPGEASLSGPARPPGPTYLPRPGAARSPRPAPGAAAKMAARPGSARGRPPAEAQAAGALPALSGG